MHTLSSARIPVYPAAYPGAYQASAVWFGVNPMKPDKWTPFEPWFPFLKELVKALGGADDRPVSETDYQIVWVNDMSGKIRHAFVLNNPNKLGRLKQALLEQLDRLPPEDRASMGQFQLQLVLNKDLALTEGDLHYATTPEALRAGVLDLFPPENFRLILQLIGQGKPKSLRMVFQHKDLNQPPPVDAPWIQHEQLQG